MARFDNVPVQGISMTSDFGESQMYLAGLSQAGNIAIIDPLEGLTGFSSRHRTLDIAIRNSTTDNLLFVEEYFWSGAWYVSPKPVNISPGCISIGYAASRKPTIFGVNGGIMYEIEGKSKYLYLGFENPTIGHYKTFIEVTGQRHSAEWAWKQTRNDTTKNHFDGHFHMMAEIKPPKMSNFRLFRYTLGYDTRKGDSQ